MGTKTKFHTVNILISTDWNRNPSQCCNRLDEVTSPNFHNQEGTLLSTSGWSNEQTHFIDYDAHAGLWLDSIGYVKIGIIFLRIGKSQWCLNNTQSKYDWLFNTQSRVLQADWFILEINEKATLNINNMHYRHAIFIIIVSDVPWIAITHTSQRLG